MDQVQADRNVKIKLILPSGTTRRYPIGGQKRSFVGGDVVSVSSDVAEFCLAQKENGKAIFERINHDDSDMQAALGVQLEWPGWGAQPG